MEVGVSGSQLPGYWQGSAAAVTFFLARRFGVDAAGALQRALRAGPANLDSWNSGGWRILGGETYAACGFVSRETCQAGAARVYEIKSRKEMAMFWTNTTQTPIQIPVFIVVQLVNQQERTIATWRSGQCVPVLPASKVLCRVFESALCFGKQTYVFKGFAAPASQLQ